MRTFMQAGGPPVRKDSHTEEKVVTCEHSGPIDSSTTVYALHGTGARPASKRLRRAAPVARTGMFVVITSQTVRFIAPVRSSLYNVEST